MLQHFQKDSHSHILTKHNMLSVLLWQVATYVCCQSSSTLMGQHSWPSGFCRYGPNGLERSPRFYSKTSSLCSLFMTYFPWAQHCPQLNASVLDRLPSSTHRKDRCSVVSDPIQWLWAMFGLVLLEVVSSLMKACESQQKLHGDGLHQEHWELVKWKLRSCSKRPLSRGIPRCHSSSLCV